MASLGLRFLVLLLSLATVYAAYSLQSLTPSLVSYYWQLFRPQNPQDASTSYTGPVPGQHAQDSFTHRIVAVGDLHGDLPNALKVLKMAGVINEDGDWSGEIDSFVQTGDIIDRGDDTIALFDLMDKLRAQAHTSEQQVLSHLGNHEWMNVIGDWRYVWPTEVKTFGGMAQRQKMIATGPIGRTWAANYSTTSRLPLHPSLGPANLDYPPPAALASTIAPDLTHSAYSFVHGGLSPSYQNLTPFPSAINEIGKSLLYKLQHQDPLPNPHPPYPYPGFPASVTHEEAALMASNGPLWFRGWALEDDSWVCTAVDDVLQRTGTKRMIMGHTPTFDRMISRCDGKIIIIDTGISHAYGGVLSALSVDYTLTPTDKDKSEWIEHELVRAIYLDQEAEVFVNTTRTIKADLSAFR